MRSRSADVLYSSVSSSQFVVQLETSFDGRGIFVRHSLLIEMLMDTGSQVFVDLVLEVPVHFVVLTGSARHVGFGKSAKLTVHTEHEPDGRSHKSVLRCERSFATLNWNGHAVEHLTTDLCVFVSGVLGAKGQSPVVVVIALPVEVVFRVIVSHLLS